MAYQLGGLKRGAAVLEQPLAGRSLSGIPGFASRIPRFPLPRRSCGFTI